MRDASFRLKPALLISTSTPPASGHLFATILGNVATCMRNMIHDTWGRQAESRQAGCDRHKQSSLTVQSGI
eukprot:scaffold21674_cov15-Tisochrysis_lutea.AAC.1